MNNDLFQVILFLNHPVSLLNLIAIGGFPHVVVRHDTLDRLPRKLYYKQTMCVDIQYESVSERMSTCMYMYVYIHVRVYIQVRLWVGGH